MEKNELEVAFGVYRGEKSSIQGFGGISQGMRTLERTRRRRQDNIKEYLK